MSKFEPEVALGLTFWHLVLLVNRLIELPGLPVSVF
jgi:hypothetical protein